ncbi:unnamed protein product [Rodentolepis nana]|uniref:Uncharacterized protein n=1 Tax=Rodentolepis nana TaxID=102285 RepID=A0A0R3TFI7_RODNA|nr:unnamed protein product [Rodentolepis nana]
MTTFRPLPLPTICQILTSSAQQRHDLSFPTRLFFTSLYSPDGSFPHERPTTQWQSNALLSPAMTPPERLWKQTTTGTRFVSNVYLYETHEPPYSYRKPTLQRTALFELASRDQSSGKHTPEDFGHGLSQLNIRSTRTLITDRCFWRNIKQDSRQWTKYCPTILCGQPYNQWPIRGLRLVNLIRYADYD